MQDNIHAQSLTLLKLYYDRRESRLLAVLGTCLPEDSSSGAYGRACNQLWGNSPTGFFSGLCQICILRRQWEIFQPRAASRVTCIQFGLEFATNPGNNMTGCKLESPGILGFIARNLAGKIYHCFCSRLLTSSVLIENLSQLFKRWHRVFFQQRYEAISETSDTFIG